MTPGHKFLIMETPDETDKLETSMKVSGKRLEVMKKRNETSLVQNELLMLESELRQLELKQEDGAAIEETVSTQKPKRHLPDIPSGRRVSFDTKEPPKLYLLDESNMDIGSCTPLSQNIGKSSTVEPKTSTPSVLPTKPQVVVCK